MDQPPRLNLRNAVAFHDPDVLPGVVFMLPRRRGLAEEADVRLVRGDPTLLLELEVGLELLLRPMKAQRGQPWFPCVIDTVCVRSRGRCARVGLLPQILA